jgi:hypothetical protein
VAVVGVLIMLAQLWLVRLALRILAVAVAVTTETHQLLLQMAVQDLLLLDTQDRSGYGAFCGN